MAGGSWACGLVGSVVLSAARDGLEGRIVLGRASSRAANERRTRVQSTGSRQGRVRKREKVGEEEVDYQLRLLRGDGRNMVRWGRV